MYNCVYLCQCIRVHPSGSVRVAKAVLPAARASYGRVLRPPQRIMSAHRHGHGGGRTAAALRAIEGRSHALPSSKQQLPGTEVTRNGWGTPLHDAPVTVAVTVVRAAEGAAE